MDLFLPLKTLFLDPSHVRSRSRRPALVPDSVGYLEHGYLGPLGGLTPR